MRDADHSVVRCGGWMVRPPTCISQVVIGTRGVESLSTQFGLQAAMPKTATTSAKPPLLDWEVQDGDWTPLKWDADGGGAGGPWVWLYNLHCVFALYLSQSLLPCHLDLILLLSWQSVVSPRPLKRPPESSKLAPVTSFSSILFPDLYKSPTPHPPR